MKPLKLIERKKILACVSVSDVKLRSTLRSNNYIVNFSRASFVPYGEFIDRFSHPSNHISGRFGSLIAPQKGEQRAAGARLRADEKTKVLSLARRRSERQRNNS